MVYLIHIHFIHVLYDNREVLPNLVESTSEDVAQLHRLVEQLRDALAIPFIFSQPMPQCMKNR